ncbi:MAG: hypothetical protein RMK57_01620 [Bryobacterales bacterium]|nr:hypothetical protein [Bryobacteraceae bacterium]MDW8353203.1 hypothetical protein [Bryobacterales bacterium]
MVRPGQLARAGLCLALACVLLWAAFLALERAWADHLFGRRNPRDRARAAALAPGNADYRVALDSSADLEAAVRLNPYHTAARIELALRAELAGDLRRAEALLLEAARFDRTYEPLWAVANFYFRRGHRKQFLRWARAANEMAYMDQSALFDLCWRLSSDGEEILREAIPDRVEIVAQYLDYLLRHGRLDAASGAAERLVELAWKDHVPLLVAYVDALIRGGQAASAWQWWDRLATRRLIPYSPPNAARPLTNGDFRVSPFEGGFDWRLSRPPGTHAQVVPSVGEARFSFSGRQPERCRLLEQILRLPPRGSCRLRFRYHTAGFACPGGLSWRLADLADRSTLALAAHDLCSSEPTTSQIEFTTPAGAEWFRLSLEYARPLGAIRIEGELVLSGVTLECSGPPGG